MLTHHFSLTPFLKTTVRRTGSFAGLLCLAVAASGQANSVQGAGNQASLDPAPRQWIWPMPGTDGSDWVINNYVDLDPGSGVLDYQGGSKTYNGHTGIDIDVPSFLAMDADFPIRTVERGVVVATDDIHFDRNLTCVGQWNFVTVLHDNGLTTTYGHLKQHSVVVSPGQVVARGQTLGVVGSSGCSTYPHLHLETRDALNAVVDPFSQGFWENPPVYDTPLSLMQAIITEGPVNGIGEIADPGPNPTALAFGDTLGVGLSVAGGLTGDQTLVLLKKPDGTTHSQHTFTFTQTYRHSFWIWNFNPSNIIGTWSVEVLTNGQAAASFQVDIGPPANSSRVERFRIDEADYQGEFDFYVAHGYRPVWLDGYDAGGTTYFNVIFEQGPPPSWIALHHLSGSALDSWLSQFTSTGWRPTLIESYFLGGSVRYAVLAENTPGPNWAAYRAVSSGTHQNNFNSLAGQGYHGTTMSPLLVGGSYSITALYEQSNVGGWTAYYGMDAAGYQSLFTSEAQAGRVLSYLNVYDANGTPRFSAMWNSVQPNSWAGLHGLSLGALNSQHDSFTGQGLLLRFITGYAQGASELFAGRWSN